MNYDNYLFRVSSLGYIMAAAEFSRDKYNGAYQRQLELFGKMNKLETEYEAIVNKNTATAVKKFEAMEKAQDAFYSQRTLTKSLENLQDYVEISEGCKTHLMDVWVAHEFGRVTRDIKSKYIEKGIQMEDTGIISYGIVKGWIPEKCTERRDDGFIMGEIDFRDHDTIYDNKSSWDIWTFYRNVKYLDNPKGNPYYPNMQGYMKLWDMKKSKVVYTLLDTPEKLIENEQKRIQYDFIGNDEMLQAALDEIRKNLTYGDIPLDRRVIEINIERDEEYIENIPLVVKACRTYLNNIKTIYYEMDKEPRELCS